MNECYKDMTRVRGNGSRVPELLQHLEPVQMLRRIGAWVAEHVAVHHWIDHAAGMGIGLRTAVQHESPRRQHGYPPPLPPWPPGIQGWRGQISFPQARTNAVSNFTAGIESGACYPSIKGASLLNELDFSIQGDELQKWRVVLFP